MINIDNVSTKKEKTPIEHSTNIIIQLSSLFPSNIDREHGCQDREGMIRSLNIRSEDPT